MKIVLKEGKQKELINKEKELFNLSFPQLSEKLGIKKGRLYAYYYDKLLISEEIFLKFSLSGEYSKYIIERKEENWGKIKGGKNSKGNTKKITEPVESIELAELYGIMLGDGNLNKSKNYKVGTYQMKIVGDSRLDKEYILRYVKPLIENLFSIKVFSKKEKNKNALYLLATGKLLVEFLESKGFKPGDKIRNQLNIPDWIKKDKSYLKACIRGLYDTDGSIYKLTNQNSYQISFRNYNFTLIKEVREKLLELGIGVSNITKGNELLITKKSELRSFLNTIGFKNSRHLDKVKMWNLAS